jgi:signal transduction histidine kinase
MNDIFSLLPFIAGCASLYLAVIVFFAGKNISGRLPFTLFSFGMALWGIFITLFLFTSSPQLGLVYVHVYYLAALLLIYGFLLFCIGFSAVKIKKQTITYWGVILSLPIFVIAACIVSPNILITDVMTLQDHSVVLNEVPYWLYAALFLLYGFLSLFLLIHFLNVSTNHLKKRQVKLVAVIMSVCLPLGAFFNLLLPLFGIYNLIMVGPLFTVPIVVTVFYAIMRHSMFDIKLTVVRTLTYGFSLASLALIYYALAYTLSVALFQSSGSFIQDPLSIGLALLLAFIFQPIKRFFDQLTNKIFYRENYSLDEFITRLSRKLSSNTDIQKMLEQASQEIARTLKSRQVFFSVFYQDRPYFFAGTGVNKRLKTDDAQAVKHYFETTQQDILIRHLAHEQTTLHHILVRYHVQIVVPLWQNGKLVSCLFVGDRENSNSYVNHDIKTLLTVRDELVIAIQNALSFRQIKDFNITLQDRIDEATAQLRRSNVKLQQLDEAKDEFISMASHQLRTPLTSVKGYLSMALEGDAGKLTAPQQKIIQEAYSSSQRMVYLIGDFLNVSRLKTGKFVVEYTDVNLAKIIDEELEQLTLLANSRNLKLVYDVPKHFPATRLDESKIRQAIMNLVDNAIYYSPEKSTVHLSLSVHDKNILFQVKDQGIGVPDIEQKDLFNKFFRAKNARRARPDGTGIGLFMVKKVITAHGGKVIFHSVEGKGSTFGFTLPVVQTTSDL